MPEDFSKFAPRKLTFEAARLEQLRSWSTKTVAERLTAMTELNRRMLKMRGIHLDDATPDLTPRRVSRRKG